MMLELSVPSGNTIAASSIDRTDNEHDAVARDDSRRKSEAALEKFDTWISTMNTTEVEPQRKHRPDADPEPPKRKPSPPRRSKDKQRDSSRERVMDESPESIENSSAATRIPDYQLNQKVPTSPNGMDQTVPNEGEEPFKPSESFSLSSIHKLVGEGIVSLSEQRSRRRGSVRQSSRATTAEMILKHDKFRRCKSAPRKPIKAPDPSDLRREADTGQEAAFSPLSKQYQEISLAGFRTPPPPATSEEMMPNEGQSLMHIAHNENPSTRLEQGIPQVPAIDKQENGLTKNDIRRNERRGSRSLSMSQSEHGRQGRNRSSHREKRLSKSDHGGRPRSSSLHRSRKNRRPSTRGHSQNGVTSMSSERRPSSNGRQRSRSSREGSRRRHSSPKTDESTQ